MYGMNGGSGDGDIANDGDTRRARTRVVEIKDSRLDIARPAGGWIYDDDVTSAGARGREQVIPRREDSHAVGRGKRATKLRQRRWRKERQSDHAPDLAPLAHTSVIIQTQRGAYQRRSDSESSESSSGSSSRSCSGDQLVPSFCASSITSSPPSSAGRGASASRMRRASSASSRRTASRTGYRIAIDGIIPPALSRITADGML